MVNLPANSIEWRILALATEHYPITVEALRRKLHLSTARLERLLRQMELQHLVTVDRLPYSAYVRPIARIGRTGKARTPDKQGETPSPPTDADDPSYA